MKAEKDSRKEGIMLKQRQRLGRWMLTISVVWVLLGALLALCQPPCAAATAGLVTTDYYVSHTSIEPFYKQYKLDPHVVLHVREVVLAGRERTVPQDGKVLLLVHGAGDPGCSAFDLDHENCSMMRYFARAGWDTFVLDIEGYGLSTRPPVMDAPSAFPECKAPIHTEVAISDVGRVIDFIRSLRGVNKVYLLGWSAGASRTTPLYTIQHPEEVAKLVLFAPGYRSLGFVDAYRPYADTLDTQTKVLVLTPSMETLYQFGSKDELLVPGASEAWRAADLASDPKSGELGGGIRHPGGNVVDMFRAKPQFDASKIKVPTLVIRGALDTFGTSQDCQLLTDELGSEVKQFVEIPAASHFVAFEKANLQFFKAVKDFLEAKVEKKAN
jgi:pimeloyl-ACP methyl ester carboxylesterase